MSEAKSKAAPIYTVTSSADGFVLCRDDVPMKTPAGNSFSVPTASLAEAIAQEFRAQGRKPNPATMPLAQLAMTAIDIVGRDRAKAGNDVAAYANNELLCHRAAEPTALAERQQREWQPLLDWCAKRFAAKLKVQTGIMPFAQPPEATEALRAVVGTYDNFHLAGLQQAVSVSGSLILGLALIEGHLNAGQMFNAAELDALYQIEKWGEDPALLARHAGIKHDLVLCEQWFRLLPP